MKDKLIIPEQVSPITYYTIKFSTGNELRNIKSNLLSNQTAYVLIELSDLSIDETSNAVIFPISDNNIMINYNKTVLLNLDTPTVLLKIYNINNLNLIECVSFYKNNYMIL
jgi:hypothetical protein